MSLRVSDRRIIWGAGSSRSRGAWASVALALGLFALGCNPHVDRQGHVTNDYIGKPVEIRGKSANAKGGAVVLIDEQVIYVRPLESWPSNVEGKRVVVRGVLAKMQYLPVATKNDKGEISQGVEGGALQNVITLGDWEVEKLGPPEPAKP